MRLSAKRLAFIGVCASLLARHADAQVFRGRLLELGSRAPLPGALVTLLDAKDVAVKTAAADDSGRYIIRADRAGTYSLTVRAIAHGSVTTTPYPLRGGETVTIDLDLVREVETLDTVKIVAKRPFHSVTPGREQFEAHYKRGIGLFISGAEIEASKLPLIDYVAQIPGLAEFGAGKNPLDHGDSRDYRARPDDPDAAASETRGRRDGRKSLPCQDPRTGDTFVICDYTGRFVFPVDAPCVTTRVDRMGVVRMVHGTEWLVNTNSGGNMIVKTSEIIGVEIYRSRQEAPPEWRFVGQSFEEMRDRRNCALIQIWTRTAW